MANRPGRPPKPDKPAPAFARMASELSGCVASHGTDRVAEVLGVAVTDFAPMLEGRVAPPTHKLRLLRPLARALGR